MSDRVYRCVFRRSRLNTFFHMLSVCNVRLPAFGQMGYIDRAFRRSVRWSLLIVVVLHSPRRPCRRRLLGSVLRPQMQTTRTRQPHGVCLYVTRSAAGYYMFRAHEVLCDGVVYCSFFLSEVNYSSKQDYGVGLRNKLVTFLFLTFYFFIYFVE
jgi:hypothetical protein